MTKAPQHIRHGDCLLTRVDALPNGTSIQHKGEHILAYGEITGHAHRLHVKSPDNMKVIQVNGDTYICLMEMGTLTHEEHKQLEIVPAIYKLSFEREHDYALQSMRKVQD